MNTISDIASKHLSKMDSSFLKTIDTEFSEQSNPLADILGVRDRLTTVLLCNLDDYDLFKEELDKQPGFYELIKSSYIENGKIILIKDENLKLKLLKQKRKNKILKKSEKVSN